MAWHPFRNLGLKLAALGLSLLLWLTITGQQVERRIPSVPLSYRNVPQTLIITEQPATVDLVVRGSANEVSRLVAGQVSVVVDLIGAQSGENLLPLGLEDARVPLGVEVTRIDPGMISVRMEEAGVAEVPIRPTVDGVPADGFVQLEPIVEPRTVAVVGPASHLTPTTTAMTDRISIQGLSSDVTRIVSVRVNDPQLRLREPRTARVLIRIIPTPVQRTYADRRIHFRGLADTRQAEATPASVAVTLSGARAGLDGLDPASIMPYVDLTDLAPGEHDRPVNLDLPPEFSLVGIEPATVPVRIR